MKARFSAAICFIAALAPLAFAQQAKLEGIVSDDKGNRVAAVNIIAPGGQANVTDAKGHFTIAFPAPVQPGQATRLEVGKPGWVIFEPLLGNCVTQSTARNFAPLQVIIVPKGSPLALSPKRLSQVIARWAHERVQLRSQVKEQQSQLDEYAFLREYAEQYGFTLEQFRAAADQWAQRKESDDKEEQATKEYWLKNYDRAAVLAREAALGADEELERANKERIEAGRKVIRRFRLEGSAFYKQNKFREALAAYNEIERRFSARKLSREDLAEEWVETKNSIGITKWQLGEKVEGQESQSLLAEAVTACREALAVFTREQSPQQWAVMQNNLGVILNSQGERASGEESVRRLAEAVFAHREALGIGLSEQSPQDWAMRQNNLGNALRAQGERMNGEESMRLLTQAIIAFREALKVFTPEQLLPEWATTQNNLGNALRAQGERTSGAERMRLLAEAVTAFREVSKVRTRDQAPQAWAASQINLGGTLNLQSELASGEENVRLLTEAVTAFHEALKVFTREQSPQQWASVQNNIGAALSLQGERLSGEKSVRLLAEAVAAYREALKVFTTKQLSHNRATTQNNLGRALWVQGERTSGTDGVRLLAEAVTAFRETLKAYSREHSPHQWAVTQNNLGDALRSQGERTGGTEGVRLFNEAVAAYREALKIFSREQLPQQWSSIHHNLSIAFALLKNWKDAAVSLENILALSPNNQKVYQVLAAIYKEYSFEYAKAYALHDQWLRRFPADAAAQAAFAETHFTTGRFAEFAARLPPLLAHPELPAATKLALQMIEVANLLSLDQAAQVPAALSSLRAKLAAQPAAFRVTWSFAGTLHFVNHQAGQPSGGQPGAPPAQLAAYRAWLQQFFAVAQAADRDALLQALRTAESQFPSAK
jgi:tetratricopeptide (TPR) repeat protein